MHDDEIDRFFALDYSGLLAGVQRFAGSWAESEDLVQEALLRASRRRARRQDRIARRVGEDGESASGA
jgi:DNA-directed RNA polymerase specialized sigma24 family protein